MKHLILSVALASLALSACNRHADDTATPGGAATSAAQSATSSETQASSAPTKQRQMPASAEEIGKIEATGKNGLWADVQEVCPKDVKSGVSTTLTWNVKDKGVEKVVVYVIGKDGEERNFGQGGPVGRKLTGPWLKPGTMFRLRDKATKQELAAITIGEKSC